MSQELNTLAEDGIKYWPVLLFAGTQIFGYIKMKLEVVNIMKSINGIGSKLRDLDKKLDEQSIETILSQADIRERISHLEGVIKGEYKPSHKNGKA